MLPIKKELTRLLAAAFRQAFRDFPQPAEIESSFQVPRQEKFGDISTHIVLKFAKEVKKSPNEVANELLGHLERLLGDSPLGERISKAAVEGPGFINFFYSDGEIARVISEIKRFDKGFGKPDIGHRKILLEFVSANPTGPLTVAHGRQAALGDSLKRILLFCGHDVSTEYYNNDEGVQIDTLGKSAQIRVEEILSGKKMEIPENYYQGLYLVDTAGKLIQAKRALYEKASPEERLRLCADFAKQDILNGIQKDLGDFDVCFDNFYSQERLMKSGKVEDTLRELEKKGVLYESDGALWFRSTDYGDDKDRVVRKGDKTYTYLTPDMAYHHEKFARGFEEIINIWGPDHHGYIARLKASQAALGHDPGRIRILIAQLVTLYEGKKQVRMSTRAGEFITLREILDEVGPDAGRFFFLMRKFDAHLDFDLALAKSQTPDNPVFYIQYAHARIESIQSQFRETGLGISWKDDACLERLKDPLEKRLMRLLWQYEDTVLAAERTLEPYRLVPYLMELAAAFHRFYTENRVITEDASLTQARMMLVISVQTVIRSGLGLLGVSAPAKM